MHTQRIYQRDENLFIFPLMHAAADVAVSLLQQQRQKFEFFPSQTAICHKMNGKIAVAAAVVIVTTNTQFS